MTSTPHILQTFDVLCDAVTGVVREKSVTDVPFLQESEEGFGAGKKPGAFIDGIIHIQKDLPDFVEFDHMMTLVSVLGDWLKQRGLKLAVVKFHIQLVINDF